jgi:hypothetical protein
MSKTVTVEDFAKWIKDIEYAFNCDIADFHDWTLQVLRHGSDVWLIEVSHTCRPRGPSLGAPCNLYWASDGTLQTITFDNGLEVRLSAAEGAALSRAARSWAEAVEERHTNLFSRYLAWARDRFLNSKSLEQLDRADEERRTRSERDHLRRPHLSHMAQVQRVGEAGYINSYPLW